MTMWLLLIYLGAAYGAPLDALRQSRLHLSPASNITELTNTACRIDDWPRLPDTAICDKYYVCDARFGYLAAQYCPEGMAFSTGEQECHLVDRVDCASRPNFHNMMPIFDPEHKHNTTGMNMTLLEMNLAQPNITGLAPPETVPVPGTGPTPAGGYTPTGGAAGTTPPSIAINGIPAAGPAPSTLLTSTTGFNLTFPVPVQISLPKDAVLTIPVGTVIYLPPGYNVSIPGTETDTSLTGTSQPSAASTSGNFQPVDSSVLTNLAESFAGPGATPITPAPSAEHAHHHEPETTDSGTAGTGKPVGIQANTGALGANETAGTPNFSVPASTTGTGTLASTGLPADSAGVFTPVEIANGAGTSDADADSTPRPISSPVTGTSNASAAALEELAEILENEPIISATGMGTIGTGPLHSGHPAHHNATDSALSNANAATSISSMPVPSSITTTSTDTRPEAVHQVAGSNLSLLGTVTNTAGNDTFPLSLGSNITFPSQAPGDAGTSTDSQTAPVGASSAAMAGIPPPGAIDNPPPKASTPVKIYGPPSPANISFPTKGASSTSGQSFTGFYIMNGMLFNRPMGSSSDTASQDLNSLVQYLQKYTAGMGTGALRSNVPAWPIPSHRLSLPNQRKVTASDCATLGQTRLPDALQCDKYYVCSSQQGLLPYFCPDGLVFDPAVQECRLPQNVDCTDRPNLQPSQGTGVCPRQNGVFRNPDNCQEFFLCAAGSFTTIECPKGLAFSFTEGACVSPDIAKIPGCEVNQDEILCAEMRNLPTGMSKLFPTNDCRTYIECTGTGQYRRRTCPSSQVFHAKLGICDDPSRVPEW